MLRALFNPLQQTHGVQVVLLFLIFEGKKVESWEVKNLAQGYVVSMR